MNNQTGKRIKKEVYVYERGIDLWTMLGELTDDQIAVEGLIVNQEKTEHMRKIMVALVKEVKKEFAPNGIKDEETLLFVNSTIKNIFGEVVRDFDFNNQFNGYHGEYIKTLKYIQVRVMNEREMMVMAESHDNKMLYSQDIEEDFF